MSGSTKNYKFGPKNNWRRWLWNQVLRRTNGREKSELILYLAGPQDLDRLVVGGRVPSRNMIAIDRCEWNVATVRSAGNYAVHADALEVLRAWPARFSVAAVVLDLCSGLWRLEELGKLSALLSFHPALNGAVLAVNFQRGRDAAANDVMVAVNSGARRWDEIQKHLGASLCPKHRAFAFAINHSFTATCALNGTHEMIWSTLQLFQPAFFSYRSGVLTFDSVVMDSFSSHFVNDDPETVRLVWKGVENLYEKDAATVRKIAATLATRTRQMRLSA